jgi:hypothetical protein
MLNLESRGSGHSTVAFDRSSLAPQTSLARRTANEPTRDGLIAGAAHGSLIRCSASDRPTPHESMSCERARCADVRHTQSILKITRKLLILHARFASHFERKRLWIN